MISFGAFIVVIPSVYNAHVCYIDPCYYKYFADNCLNAC